MARSTGRKRFWFQQNKDEDQQQVNEQKDTSEKQQKYINAFNESRIAPLG